MTLLNSTALLKATTTAAAFDFVSRLLPVQRAVQGGALQNNGEHGDSAQYDSDGAPLDVWRAGDEAGSLGVG